MNVVLDPAFLEKLKKVNVRIRKNVKERQIGEKFIAYFVTLGTHDQLYGKDS